MPEEILDLTDWLPNEVEIVMGRQSITISTDVTPMLVARVNRWMYTYVLVAQAEQAAADGTPLPENDPPTPSLDWEEGWALAEVIAGQDLRFIGKRALVKFLDFFLGQTSVLAKTLPSETSSESPASSTEASPLETSTETDGSSGQPSTP